MEPWDDRGQSVQIGAVLLFAVLILLFSSYQAFVVPQQNQAAEFEHNQAVKGDLLDLRNAVVSTLGNPSGRSVSVRLGTTYPTRVIATNPAPPSGTLRTVGTTDDAVNLSVDNATAIDPETDDFWNGTRRNYSTGGIEYRPNYNEYGQPPVTVYEASVLYDRFAFEGTNLTRSDQALVDGNRIRLVALNGSLRRSSSGTTAVDVQSVNASETTVSVRNESADEPVTIRVATQLPAEKWEELLADQNVTRGGQIAEGGIETEPLGVPGYRMLAIELVPGTYELQMAKAGVGTRVSGTDPAYMTDVAADGSTVPEDGSVRLTVEVRDAYNNPAAGVDVTGNSTNESIGTLNETVMETDGDGRATFRFEAKSVTAATEVPVEFNFTLDSSPSAFNPDDPEDVEAVVEVQNTKVPGGGGGGAGYSLTWTDALSVPGTTSGGEGCASTPLPCDVPMQSETSEPQIGAPVGFGSSDTGVARVLRRSTATNSDGTARTTVRFERSVGNATLWTQSAGANDTRAVSTPSYESFESGFGTYGVFGSFQGGDPQLSTQNANTGSSSVVLPGGNDGGIVTTEYDTTGAEMVVVQYWAQDVGAEEGDADTGLDEDLAVEYLTAAGTWEQADLLEARGDVDNPQSPTYHRMVRLGVDALHGNFSLRFRQVAADAANDEWLVDDPQISVIGKAVGGGEAGGRTPGSGGGSLAYNADATAVDGPDTDETTGGVEFSITNGFDQRAQITSVELSGFSGNPRLNDRVAPNDQNRRTEIYVTSDVSDGWVDVNDGAGLPTTFDMDGDGFSNNGNPEASSGTTFDVSLFEFENNGGNRIDMSGESFQVTVSYELADGTTGTETFTVNVS